MNVNSKEIEQISKKWRVQESMPRHMAPNSIVAVIQPNASQNSPNALRQVVANPPTNTVPINRHKLNILHSDMAMMTPAGSTSELSQPRASKRSNTSGRKSLPRANYKMLGKVDLSADDDVDQTVDTSASHCTPQNTVALSQSFDVEQGNSTVRGDCNELIAVEEADSTTKSAEIAEHTFHTKRGDPVTACPNSPPNSVDSDDVIFVSMEYLTAHGGTNQNAEETQSSERTPPPMSPPPSVAAIDNPNVFYRSVQGQLILGTIMENSDGHCLVRFADGSETWCAETELRKFDDDPPDSPEKGCKGSFCNACKTQKNGDVLEVCKRCGRAYHRDCTAESEPGSDVYICIRCEKPMNQIASISKDNTKRRSICRKFLYEVEKLNWDQNHRVNVENVYCYCGRKGNYTHNMLQCCKCKNWFHTSCIDDFGFSLLPGDYFFVFCCTVCNNGEQFLRRLQITWVDVLRLAFFNCMLLHTKRKYFSFVKDIKPFLLNYRPKMPLCDEWLQMKDEKFASTAKAVLDSKPRLFTRPEKRPNTYCLNDTEPPLLPEIYFFPNEKPCDEILRKRFKLKLMPAAVGDTAEDYEGTSEDEVPIQRMIEGLKRRQTVDEATTIPAKRHKFATAQVSPDTSSARKSYQLLPTKVAFNSLCSMVNVPPARGCTILDRLIPPLANYTGENDPFRLPSPEKVDKGKVSKASKMVRMVKRRLNEDDIKGGKPKNMRVRRSRSTKRDAVEVISTLTLNQYPQFQRPAIGYSKNLASVPWISPRRRAANHHLSAQRYGHLKSASGGKPTTKTKSTPSSYNGSIDTTSSMSWPPTDTERSSSTPSTNGTESNTLAVVNSKERDDIFERECRKILMERQLPNGAKEYLLQWN